LGDAATDEIMQGWKEGYEFLADLLIGMEDNLKKVHANTKGQLLLFPEMRRETKKVNF
jgi:hemoglobin-like flavoprotein